MKTQIFRNCLADILCTMAVFLSFIWSIPDAYATDSGQVQEPKITVICSGKTVEWVLDQIREQTQYSILVRNNDVDLKREVSLDAKEWTISRILKTMFGETDIRWEISGTRISIYRPMNSHVRKDENLIRISGKVSDRQGNPVIGATVMVEGTTNGTSSDSEGIWTLYIDDTDQHLVVSCIGYKTGRTGIGSDREFYIVLDEDTAMLDEIVVVGYGIQKKSVVTAAISSVKGDELSIVTPTSMDNVLKGMVSGVSIISASGQPGEGARIRVRGTGTINDSNPLYIVDGMPVSGGIAYLNPADIESVEVLKDAASAAIYGSRGANGVILVTTRRGTEGKASVSYNFSYGWQNAWRKLDMLNATEYAVLANEMAMNDGNAPQYPDPASFGDGTDWQKEIENRNAPVINHNISVSGGNNWSNYYISAGYLYQEGIIGGNYNNSNYERLTLRANNNSSLFDVSDKRDWLNSMRIGTNISYTHDKSRSISSNSERGTVLGSALALSPMLPVYAENPEELLAEHPAAVTDADGRPFAIAGDSFAMMPNPVALLNIPSDTNLSDKLVANMNLELEIYRGLIFKTSIGGTLEIYSNDGYELPYYLNSNKQSESSSVWSTVTKGFSWQIENTLSYNFTLSGRHNFSLLAGQSASSQWDSYLSGTSFQIRDASQPWIDATDQDIYMRSTSGSPSPYSRLASYFGRIGYNFDERYMIEFTFRRDGSSNFSPENKWANFPSVSAGWNITNEPFMANRPSFLTALKLRASWGLNGNQNISAFRYTSMMEGGADYILGIGDMTAIAPGSVPQTYANADLKWEESEQTDVGLDVLLFDNRLSLGLDWYRKRTNGMLMEMALPGYIGNNRPYGNVGDMQNSGFEFDISLRTCISEVNINIGANGSYNKNRLIRLGNETGTQNYDEVLGLGVISRAENGEPFPFFYGWKTAGIFQNKEQIAGYVNSDGELLQPDAVPGDVIFIDYNGDGVIDDGDRTKLGKGTPDWTLGFNIGLEWKGIDFNAFFHAMIGNDIYDASRRYDNSYVNMPSYMLNRWCGPGTSSRWPRLTSSGGGGPNQNYRSSDLFVYDGSFLRLRSLQIGYTVPDGLTRKIFIKRFRIYFSAENLFTLTGYHGLDPEISSGGTSVGIDKGIYPQPRTLTVGANIIF